MASGDNDFIKGMLLLTAVVTSSPVTIPIALAYFAFVLIKEFKNSGPSIDPPPPPPINPEVTKREKFEASMDALSGAAKYIPPKNEAPKIEAAQVKEPEAPKIKTPKIETPAAEPSPSYFQAFKEKFKKTPQVEPAAPAITAPTPAAQEVISTVKVVPATEAKAQVAQRVGLMNHPPQKMDKVLTAINDYFKDKGGGWEKDAGQGHDIQFKDNRGNQAFEVHNDKMVVKEHSSDNMEAMLVGFKAMYGKDQKPAINCPPELEQKWKDVAAKLHIEIDLKGPVPKAEQAAMKAPTAGKPEVAMENTAPRMSK
jgi:hypothetical protein